MRLAFHTKKLASLYVQRNILLALVVMELAVLLIQALLLFRRVERTIVMPPEITQSFWVEGNRFSPIYLEEQGMYVVHLLMDVSPATVMPQGEIILRYVDPAAFGDIKTRLHEMAARLKKDNMSLVFTPVECTVFPEDLAVEIAGDLAGYMGGRRVTSHRETYRVVFTSKQGRLFLREVRCIRTDQKDLESRDKEGEDA